MQNVSVDLGEVDEPNSEEMKEHVGISEYANKRHLNTSQEVEDTNIPDGV